MQGNASGGERAKHTGRVANSLIDSAWAVIEQKSLLPEHPPSGSYTVHQFQFCFRRSINMSLRFRRATNFPEAVIHYHSCIMHHYPKAKHK